MKHCLSPFHLLLLFAIATFPAFAQHNFVHQKQALYNQKNPDNELFRSKGSLKNIKQLPPLESDYEVFAWYPNWDKNYYKSMNYGLVSIFAYFSYPVDPKTGNTNGFYDWKSTALVDSVRQNGKKILLTASNFGPGDNSTLLNNPTSCNTLISNLVSNNSQRQGNGICVDFEGVSNQDRNVFSNFLTQLKRQLSAQNKNNLLYVTLPAVDWDGSYQLSSLTNVVDRFVIMGYDYYSSYNKQAGPVSPLASGKLWGSYNLQNSVAYYLGKNVPANKLILALPFFGETWTTASTTPGAAGSYLESPAYNYIRSNYAPGNIDAASQSICTNNGSGNSFKQCWYEGDSSFAAKIDFIKSQKLAGLGIWALGYDSGFSDLWVTILKSLSKYDIPGLNALIAADSSAQAQSDTTSWVYKLEKNLKPVTDYESVSLYVIALLTIFGSLGILIGLFFPDTRLFFFSSATVRNCLVFVTLVLLVVLLRATDVLDNNSLIFIFGFTAGALSIYLISEYIEKKRKNLP